LAGDLVFAIVPQRLGCPGRSRVSFLHDHQSSEPAAGGAACCRAWFYARHFAHAPRSTPIHRSLERPRTQGRSLSQRFPAFSERTGLMRDLGVTIGRLSLRIPSIATDTARSNCVPTPDELRTWQGVPPPARIPPGLPMGLSCSLLQGRHAWMSPVAAWPATPALPALASTPPSPLRGGVVFYWPLWPIYERMRPWNKQKPKRTRPIMERASVSSWSSFPVLRSASTQRRMLVLSKGSTTAPQST